MAGGEGMQEAGGAVNIETQSVAARIVDALRPFGDPVEKSLLYAAANKRPRRYYTFVVQSLGDAYGDDEPGCERWLVQVHLFAPLAENCILRAAQTKKALLRAGFTWPSMVDATDQDGQHYVFECETAAGVPDLEVE